MNIKTNYAVRIDTLAARVLAYLVNESVYDGHSRKIDRIRQHLLSFASKNGITYKRAYNAFWHLVNQMWISYWGINKPAIIMNTEPVLNVYNEFYPIKMPESEAEPEAEAETKPEPEDQQSSLAEVVKLAAEAAARAAEAAAPAAEFWKHI